MTEILYDESLSWVENIRLLATDDRVMGGLDGVANTAHKQLADRTAFLLKSFDINGLPVYDADVSYGGLNRFWTDSFDASVSDMDIVYCDSDGLFKCADASVYSIGGAAGYPVGIANTAASPSYIMTTGVISLEDVDSDDEGSVADVLAAGSLVYLSDTIPGKYSTTPTDVPVGRALTGNKVLFLFGNIPASGELDAATLLASMRRVSHLLS